MQSHPDGASTIFACALRRVTTLGPGVTVEPRPGITIL